VADPVIYESARSRKWRQDAASGSLTRDWFILGTDDVLEVRDLILQNSPPLFLGLSRKSIGADPLGAPDLWSGTSEYGVSAVPDGLKPDELSFKVSAGQVHVTQSKETMLRLTAADPAASGTNLTVDGANNLKVTPDGYTVIAGDVGNTVKITSGTGWTTGEYAISAASGGQWTLATSPAAVSTAGGSWLLMGTAPNCKGAIGVTLDSVQGVDIFVPKMEFTYSRQRSMVDFPYLRTLRNLVGKTNNATFYGFPVGTLIYTGCEPSSGVGTMDDGTKFLFWNLAHSFAQEETKLNVTVGPMTVVQKQGWWYVWAKYAPTPDRNQLVQQPVGVYVERMYDPGNFELLEIGS